jgi:hypothetical protein
VSCASPGLEVLHAFLSFGSHRFSFRAHRVCRPSGIACSVLTVDLDSSYCTLFNAPRRSRPAGSTAPSGDPLRRHDDGAPLAMTPSLVQKTLSPAALTNSCPRTVHGCPPRTTLWKKS